MKSYTHYIIIFILFFSVTTGKAQQLFHQDIFYGGVSIGGISGGMGNGILSPRQSEVYVEPGSTLRNVFLIAYRVGHPYNWYFTINGASYELDSTDVITTFGHSNPDVPNIDIVLIDVSNTFVADPSNVYDFYLPSITSGPPNSGVNWGWFTAFLYIEYENPLLDKISTSLWCNNLDLIGNETYNFSSLNSINTSNPVGLSVFMDRGCNNTTDGSEITLHSDGNSFNLGVIGNVDNVNSGSGCAGTQGHFYYQNNQLFGLDDDAPNSTMNTSDAISDISSYLVNGENEYQLQMVHNNFPNHSVAATNFNLLFPHVYTTPCDTFSTAAINDTVVCKGDSIQLFASGGVGYEWISYHGLNNPLISNPMASPDSTTLYVVRIENEPGCSRTEQVLVRVNELPEITSVSITPSECGEDNGQIGATAVGESPFISTIGFGAQNQAQFSDLSAGMYTLSITDQNGCTADTMVVVPEIISVDASFIASPPSGPEPLSVALNNTSQNATDYEWYIDEDFWDANVNSSAYFDSSGVYEVMLIAYNNLPECADTVWLTILVQDTLVVQIPNVFSPNNDYSNDVFTIDIRGAQFIKATILNRWGNEMSYLEQDLTPNIQTLPIWNGLSINLEPATEGVYFYLFEITDVKGEVFSFSGYLHLVR